MRVFSVVPSRISLSGGGCDLPSYYERTGGITINMAINIRQSLTLYTEDDMWARISSFPEKSNPEFLYDIAQELGYKNDTYHIQSTFDGEIGAGLGSSAAAIVAMLGALYTWKKHYFTQDRVAEKAWEMEQKVHITGKQDQYVCAYGGVNVMEFRDKVTVTPLSRDFIAPIYESLVLVYVGGTHNLDMQKGLIELTKDQRKALDTMKELTVGMIDFMTKRDYRSVGKLLNIAWKLKKKSHKAVSDSRIDEIYRTAKKHGALGGKVLGSGGGGYMLFIVPPEQQEDFILKTKLQYVDFSICWNGLETRIL